MDNTGKTLKVNPDKLADLLKVKAQMERLTEQQRLFMAGAAAALSMKRNREAG